MDTSETYIKMSDCPEIQEGHEWEYGDWLIAECGLFQIGTASFDYDMSDIHIPPIRSELPIATIQSRDVEAQTFTGSLIWLPRQDQLQEMVDEDFPFILNSFHDDAIHEACELPQYPTSIEQLWLAFVMKEKFNKAWNGESWSV